MGDLLFGSIKREAQKVWNVCELRLVVVMSLSLQILLILLGNRRRCISGKREHIIIWTAYLFADWIAAVALSLISHSIEEPKTDELMAFWAPFLLLHLGGPDTITAYSLEDNNLWLRHLFGLIVQGSIAAYVTMKSWTGSVVSILSVLMYVPALIKYGERTWALRSASKEHFRDSMLGKADPGPNYAKFMDEYNSMKDEGFRVILGRVDEQATVVPDQRKSNGSDDGVGGGIDDAQVLIKADYFFRMFKRLFAFLILSHEDWEESRSCFLRLQSEQALQMIDIELGFMFDELYTKASVVYSMPGYVARAISFSSTIFVFVLFLTKVDKLGHRLLPDADADPDPDVSITYLLLVSAIFLETCALVILIFSDSAFLWLTKCSPSVERAVTNRLRDRSKKKRWSNSIAQYNLLSVWLKDYNKPTWRIWLKMEELFRTWSTKMELLVIWLKMVLLRINKKLKRYWHTTYVTVDDELMKFIFTQLRSKAKEVTNLEEAKRICRFRGSELLGQQIPGLIGESIRKTIDGVEFDQSILIWHIATDLCYIDYSDRQFTYIKNQLQAFIRLYGVSPSCVSLYAAGGNR